MTTTAKPTIGKREMMNQNRRARIIAALVIDEFRQTTIPPAIHTMIGKGSVSDSIGTSMSELETGTGLKQTEIRLSLGKMLENDELDSVGERRAMRYLLHKPQPMDRLFLAREVRSCLAAARQAQGKGVANSKPVRRHDAFKPSQIPTTADLEELDSLCA